jgi:hypothetical protein
MEPLEVWAYVSRERDTPKAIAKANRIMAMMVSLRTLHRTAISYVSHGGRRDPPVQGSHGKARLLATSRRYSAQTTTSLF